VAAGLEGGGATVRFELLPGRASDKVPGPCQVVAEYPQDCISANCAEGIMAVEKVELKHIFSKPSFGSRLLSA
jgi:hypothetical protein